MDISFEEIACINKVLDRSSYDAIVEARAELHELVKPVVLLDCNDERWLWPNLLDTYIWTSTDAEVISKREELYFMLKLIHGEDIGLPARRAKRIKEEHLTPNAEDLEKMKKWAGL